MRRRLRINQIIADFSRRPISELRVMDLACLEGHYSAEMAIRGATVVGVEGRSSNLQKARELFPFPNISFLQDDVRNVSPEKYGSFDVVLCLGILYHLDAPDCFKLLEAVAEVCQDFAVIDTNIGLTGKEVVRYRGKEYRGFYFSEYETPPSPEEQEEQVWMSINNVRSFWLTRASLVNATIDAGFTSVYECHYPAWDHPVDRITLIAFKGKPEGILAVPFDDTILGERVPEEQPRSFQNPLPITVRSRGKAFLKRLLSR